jgi:FAD binding domain
MARPATGATRDLHAGTRAPRAGRGGHRRQTWTTTPIPRCSSWGRPDRLGARLRPGPAGRAVSPRRQGVRVLRRVVRQGPAATQSGGPRRPRRDRPGARLGRDPPAVPALPAGPRRRGRGPAPGSAAYAGRPYASVLIIPQWRTEQLLRQRLAELGGRVQRGTELTGLVQDAASVTATLVRAGVTERVRAGWLVGCEGGHSVIRKLLGVGFEDQTWEIEQMLVGDVEAEGLDRDHWHVWPEAEGGLVGLCPLPAPARSSSRSSWQRATRPSPSCRPSRRCWTRARCRRAAT